MTRHEIIDATGAALGTLANQVANARAEDKESPNDLPQCFQANIQKLQTMASDGKLMQSDSQMSFSKRPNMCGHLRNGRFLAVPSISVLGG